MVFKLRLCCFDRLRRLDCIRSQAASAVICGAPLAQDLFMVLEALVNASTGVAMPMEYGCTIGSAVLAPFTAELKSYC
jgi:hypothetical protein